MNEDQVAYQRIEGLPADFSDAEATSVESLRDAWVEQRSGLAEGGALSTFNQKLVRRWSIETGIIERLYTIDRGTTELLINHGLDSALIEHGTSDLPAHEIVTILRDHEDAAKFVLDHVTAKNGLTGNFVKQIHSLLTRNQDNVEAEDQFGRKIQTELRRGAWKQIPNNPRRPDGVIHEYCPPLLVEEEMETLFGLYRKYTEERVPAVIIAAWLHHRFTQIHPFQDGNGRTARALTAMAFVTFDCFPIVIDRDVREQYIASLEKADAGDLRPLVRLFALLQKKEMEEALSMSEDVLAEPRRDGGQLRAKLMESLRQRASEKRLAITQRREAVLQIGHQVFESVIVRLVNEIAKDVRQILNEELPGSDVRVEVGDSTKRHFFKSQMVQIAQREGYFGDFDTTHEWVRIRFQRPEAEEHSVDEIVISMHSLGRNFSGVLVVSAYFANRFLDEEHRSVSLDPQRLADRPLTFSYREDPSNISERAEEWTNSVLDIGIAQLLSRI